mgnify:CR=1 FL=1
MTVSISDMTVPATKKQLLADAEATVDRIAKNFRRGLITEEERYKRSYRCNGKQPMTS